MDPIYATQRVTTSKIGSKLILAILLVLGLHKAGCIPDIPERHPIECEARNIHKLTAAERAELC